MKDNKDSYLFKTNNINEKIKVDVYYNLDPIKIVFYQIHNEERMINGVVEITYEEFDKVKKWLDSIEEIHA